MFRKLLVIIIVTSVMFLSFASCINNTKKISATNAPLNSSTARNATARASANAKTSSPVSNATPIPNDLKGMPNAAATIIYDEQFNSGAADNDNGDYSEPQSLLFENGKMVFAGVFGSGYCSKELFDFSSYLQLELNTKIWSNTIKPIAQKSPWMATFVGCRLPETQELGRPHANGTWISLNGGPTVYLYSPGGVPNSKGWNFEAVSVKLPFNAGVGNIVKIIDSQDVISFYVADTSDKDYLAFKLIIAADKVTVYDNAGKEIYSCENKLQADGYFKVFNHTLEDAGDNGVDYYVLKGVKR